MVTLLLFLFFFIYIFCISLTKSSEDTVILCALKSPPCLQVILEIVSLGKQTTCCILHLIDSQDGNKARKGCYKRSRYKKHGNIKV